MRSSKSRARAKQHRPRPMGNIINRVFESSGPDGKVRGTPQQIIEKYLVLARDAQLSNDRVAAENFLQHAEHYTRMLGEAQREMAAEQEARRHQGGGQPHGHAQGGAPHEGRERFGGQQGGQMGGQNRIRYDRDDEQPHIVPEALMAVDYDDDGDSILIETPEARRNVAPRDEAPAPAETPARIEAVAAVEAPPASEEERARGPRRGPRRGRGGGGGGGAADPSPDSAAAQ
ncbi:MAG: DUF4167 domain-containing protein [Gemmobacter sp.]